jgi:hypothetical protein
MSTQKLRHGWFGCFIHKNSKIEPIQFHSTGEWKNKMWYIHTNRYYSVTGKNKVLIFATYRQVLKILH